MHSCRGLWRLMNVKETPSKGVDFESSCFWKLWDKSSISSEVCRLYSEVSSKGPSAKWRRECHWQNWINGVTHQCCGLSRRSLRCVPKHLSDLAHCAVEERWIVFSSMGEQYVIVPLLWWRSCRLLSVPSPKRLRRRCTAKSLSANQRFL